MEDIIMKVIDCVALGVGAIIAIALVSLVGHFVIDEAIKLIVKQ